ncbi:unnamed protein product [Darwinula stevensoni]|uniref:Uncharacterized protein n=1 Tax=Darwinula stevensoni TaxID=69355 RepID=A0A7R9A8W4_9CRUS|nr:unnamed protein product [Darwinula stevensoni]CAG0896819.1 unnamed protein product [Darwinula stevensoni]
MGRWPADPCALVHQVLERRGLGISVMRDVLYFIYGHMEGDRRTSVMFSTDWPGMEPTKMVRNEHVEGDRRTSVMFSTDWPGMEPTKMVRGTINKGTGLMLHPNPANRTTRTLMHWMSSSDMKIPLLPKGILQGEMCYRSAVM